ncbi:hypothetical protein LEQ41_02105 [Streptococcus agalactiae]|nr:hypothetical protein [Streptococcus agalactiae]
MIGTHSSSYQYSLIVKLLILGKKNENTYNRITKYKISNFSRGYGVGR